MENIADFANAEYVVLISIFALVFLYIIANIFFSISLYRGLKRVPAEKLLFPAWFVWMFFVPVVGYIFYWLMLPFGVPNSFRAAVPNNAEAQKRANTLFILGLIHCILLTFSFVPYVILLSGWIWIVIWIIYWIKAVKFRKLYLEHKVIV